MASNTDRNLKFFDKDGNNLNFLYNEFTEKYEGKLYFDENSDDTFKTLCLFLFENIDSFGFDLNDDIEDFLKLNKFQLFNEFGFDITGNVNKNKSIKNIEASVIDGDFYSKWIYGDNFDFLFPKGSEIRFNESISEFSNTNTTYSVVATKKDAILIISNLDNGQYNITYSGLIDADFIGKTISGLNSIQIKKYVDSNIEPNLATWSEPKFYSKLFEGQKLTLVNTENNDGVYTVDNILLDSVNYSYRTLFSDFTTNSDISTKVTLLTQLPKAYQGSFNIISNHLVFPGETPVLLRRPNTEFKLSFGLNQGNFHIGEISNFDYTPGTEYTIGDLVTFNEQVYECVQAYTQTSSLITSTLLGGQTVPDTEIDPLDNQYWTVSLRLPIEEITQDDILVNNEIILTTNEFILNQMWDTSLPITLGKLIENNASLLEELNVLYKVNSDNITFVSEFSSKYLEVEVYSNNIIISSEVINYDKVIEVKEDLVSEQNINISSNKKYEILIDDLDEFGLRININNTKYYIDTLVVNDNLGAIDLELSIDKTIRAWIEEYKLSLLKLGIIILPYAENSIFYNKIILSTVFPNVDLNFTVEVGTTANYDIDLAKCYIYDMGNSITFSFNGISYREIFDTDINQTLINWESNNRINLLNIDIRAVVLTNSITFYTKNQDKIEILIDVEKNNDPGILTSFIDYRMKGNVGTLIASNSIVHDVSGTSFIDECFSTGQIVSLTNSFYTNNNQEYNTLYINDNILTLSYQGPFFGNYDLDVLDAFLGFAFDDGFGFDASVPNVTVPPVSTNKTLIENTNSFSNLLPLKDNNDFFTFNNNGIKNFDMLDLSNVNNYMTPISLTTPTEQTPGYNGTGAIYNTTNGLIYSIDYNGTLIIYDPVSNQVVKTEATIIMPTNITQDKFGNVYISYLSVSYTKIDLALNVQPIIAPLTDSIIVVNDEYDQLVFIGANTNDYFVTDLNGTTLGNGSNLTGNTSSMGIYNPYTKKVYIVGLTDLYEIDPITFVATSIHSITTNNSRVGFTFDNFKEELLISGTNSLYRFDNQMNFIGSIPMTESGEIHYNSLDGNIYMASKSSNFVNVYSTTDYSLLVQEDLGENITNLFYNEERNSVISITENTTQEVKFLSLPNSLLKNEISPSEFLNLTTREYLRKPRENQQIENEVQVEYIYKFEDDTDDSIFMYDFSGEQIEKNSPYSYLGIKPLPSVRLNKKPNTDINKLEDPLEQQTIFEEIKYDLDYTDSSTNTSFVPCPLPLYLGFNNSDNEGVSKRKLNLIKKEDVTYTIITNSVNQTIVNFIDKGESLGEISLDINSNESFIGKNLKVGQIISINFFDNTNDTKQYISSNNGLVLKIKSVLFKTLEVEVLDGSITNESSIITNYPMNFLNTYMTLVIDVKDKVLLDLDLYGQTEIEDIRYKTELSNTGKLLAPEEVFIFKEYDINENGIDWIFLNQKRKELLQIRPDIYNYIGSYKAIINAINYFGYNELELFEYYRNINQNTDTFGKLKKIEIPDIFNNSIDGWTESAFILNSFPNVNYEETNLFNLTYRITDKEGNNKLTFSLQEVIIKLMGLKKWLEENVVPLTHNILDITGVADIKQVNSVYHDVYDVRFIKNNNTFTPITFKVPSALVTPINSNSTVYNVQVEFENIINTNLPDFFNVDIRTYKILEEWKPFETYQIGDEVRWRGKNFISITSNNKTNNPLEHEEVNDYNQNIEYSFGNLVTFQSDIYRYISNIPSQIDPTDSNTWLKVNDWKEINLETIQSFNEFRAISNMSDYNFTIDSNIDPYVIIEVTSDNGYGQIYTDRKSFEIKFDADSVDIL